MKNKNRRQGKSRKNQTGSGGIAHRLQRIEKSISINNVNSAKYIQSGDTSVGGTLTNSAPFSAIMNALAEGLGENNVRVGDKCHFNRLQLRVVVFPGAATTTNTLRCLVVRETTTLGSAVAPTQYFLDSTPGALSCRNYTTRNNKRFITYLDKTWLLGPPASPLASPFQNFSVPDMIHFDVDMPLDFTTDYSRGNAGTVADIDTNGLSILFITDNTVSGSFTPHYEYVLSFTN